MILHMYQISLILFTNRLQIFWKARMWLVILFIYKLIMLMRQVLKLLKHLLMVKKSSLTLTDVVIFVQASRQSEFLVNFYFYNNDGVVFTCKQRRGFPILRCNSKNRNVMVNSDLWFSEDTVMKKHKSRFIFDFNRWCFVLVWALKLLSFQFVSVTCSKLSKTDLRMLMLKF